MPGHTFCFELQKLSACTDLLGNILDWSRWKGDHFPQTDSNTSIRVARKPLFFSMKAIFFQIAILSQKPNVCPGIHFYLYFFYWVFSHLLENGLMNAVAFIEKILMYAWAFIRGKWIFSRPFLIKMYAWAYICWKVVFGKKKCCLWPKEIRLMQHFVRKFYVSSCNTVPIIYFCDITIALLLFSHGCTVLHTSKSNNSEILFISHDSFQTFLRKRDLWTKYKWKNSTAEKEISIVSKNEKKSLKRISEFPKWLLFRFFITLSFRCALLRRFAILARLFRCIFRCIFRRLFRFAVLLSLIFFFQREEERVREVLHHVNSWNPPSEIIIHNQQTDS